MSERGWERWEAYFDPDTYDPETRTGVMRNKLGLTDPIRLRAAEYLQSGLRQVQLDTDAAHVPQTYDLEHLRAIHRHLLGGVYEWAGELRDVRMVAAQGEPEFVKPNTGQIERIADHVHEFVAGQQWGSMTRERFVSSTATVYAYLNHAHPFREGNGRAMRQYLRDIARVSPFKIDFTSLEPSAWDSASSRTRQPGPDGNVHIDPRPLMPLLSSVTTRRDQGRPRP